MNAPTRTALLAALALLAAVPAVQAARHHHRGRMVAYDAKDRRFYSVAWARAHGMRDKGGDPLTVVPRTGLPRDAKISRAMHGHL